MWDTIEFWLIICALEIISCLFSSGKIVIKRKPKIKLNEECRKYYDECEKLLLPFYEKFGFVTSGEEFLEDGIPHTPMTLMF